MDHEDSLRHVGSTLDHLTRYWASRRKAGAAQGDETPAPPAFTIALCREAGTPGSLVAQELGKRLGWQVYDHQLLDRIAQDTGVRTSLLESVDERDVSWLREAFQSFMSVPDMTESSYVHHLVHTVLALGAHGECVIVGRAAAFILPVETTLRVRLVAPVKHRIAALSHKLHISTKEAAGQIRTIDRERNDFVQDHFYRDPTDPQNFDLVLNVGRLPVAAIAGIILEALHSLQALAAEKGVARKNNQGSRTESNRGS